MKIQAVTSDTMVSVFEIQENPALASVRAQVNHQTGEVEFFSWEVFVSQADQVNFIRAYLELMDNCIASFVNVLKDVACKGVEKLRDDCSKSRQAVEKANRSLLELA